MSQSNLNHEDNEAYVFMKVGRGKKGSTTELQIHLNLLSCIYSYVESSGEILSVGPQKTNEMLNLKKEKKKKDQSFEF